MKFEHSIWSGFLPGQNRLRIGLMVALFLSCAALSFAQQQFSGVIADEVGDPLPGATLVIQGTSNGTTTDATGAFRITANPGQTLVVTYTGYTTQSIVLGSSSTVNFTMTANDNLLEDIVVTGYTVDTRRQTTGAVSTVKSRDLTVVASGNVEQQLQGRVAGVTVITNGQPGTNSIVRVRGFGAFGGNEPLIIVDGLPVGSSDFLAPDDIESTTVLKDAAAASIYGARAANGVIVYTTKRGSKKPQRMSVSYDMQYGITNPGTGQEMLNPQEHADWTWKALENTGLDLTHPQFGTGRTPVLPDYINVGGKSGVVGTLDLAAEKAKYNVDPTLGPVYQVVRANKEGTDWYGELTRNASLIRHGLGFTGSTENSRYYVGLSLQDQEGILIHNDFRRYSFRVNTEFDIAKNLRVGENLQFTYRSVLGQQGGGNGLGIAADESDVLTAFRMPSIIPVRDEFGGYAGTAAKGFNNPRNPIAGRDGIADNRSFGGLGMGNIYLEYDLIPSLTLRSSVGGQYYNFYGNFYNRLQYENSENNASFSYGEFSGYGLSYTFTNTANFKKRLGRHFIDALGGIEALNTGKGREMSGFGLNPFATTTDYVDLSTTSAAGRTANSGQFRGVNFYSLFGQAKYSLDDKYYVTGVLRRDGASQFGINSRYGIFPAISGAWRVSGENFMKGVNFITDLKIRGGWGQMGNSRNVNPNNQFSLFGASIGDASYDITGSNSSAAEGFYKNRIGNPDAKWETSTTTNIGFDGSFLKGRLDVIFDLWRKETKDLLYQLPLPEVAGSFAAAPSVNIASMRNQGIDIQVINRGKLGAQSNYEINLTGAWLQNEITSLAPNLKFFDVSTGRLASPTTRNQIGRGISSFFGYQVVGLFKDEAEVKAAPTQTGAGPGRFRFADLDGLDDKGKPTGVPDGKIDAADRTYLGSPLPKFVGGMNLRYSIKGFDIETYLYASLGNKIYNLSKWFTDFYPSFKGAAIGARVTESWTPNNLDTDTPRFEDVSNFSTNTQSNSFYIEDGSYLRMQNISLAYNLPESILKGRIRRLKVFANLNNIFTISKYQGLDPGVGGAVDTNFGIDVGNYPVTRSFAVGVSAGL